MGVFVGHLEHKNHEDTLKQYIAGVGTPLVCTVCYALLPAHCTSQEQPVIPCMGIRVYERRTWGRVWCGCSLAILRTRTMRTL